MPHSDSACRFQHEQNVSSRMCNWVCTAKQTSGHPVPGPHPLPASRARAGVRRGLQTVPAGHCADVVPPTEPGRVP